jgi:hypothetical protein
LAFDRSPLFAFDKRAGQACHHLSERDHCKIHVRRAELGFAGCAAYDCAGAGQHATSLFAGRHWRTDPVLAREMFDVFAALREVHELLVLLQAAQALPLAPEQVQRCGELRAQLLPASGWSRERLQQFEASDTRVQVRKFVLSLKELVAIDRPKRTTSARV